MLGGRWQTLLWSHDARVSPSDPVLIQNVPEDSTDWSDEIVVAMHVSPLSNWRYAKIVSFLCDLGV